eukprot:11709116-Heterocapsa_arctica.AAC.1
MRAAYLAQDQLDISDAVKCLARAMSAPRQSHMSELKRLCRYRPGVPRVVLEHPAQDPRTAQLRRHCDSDWAGDTVSRRSTTGMIIRRGVHLLRHSSTLQTMIGASSTEAEYYALTKGACCVLGVQAQLTDWGIP